jgi:hypothetical protein
MKVVGFLFGLKYILFAHQNIKCLSVDLHYRKNKYMKCQSEPVVDLF